MYCPAEPYCAEKRSKANSANVLDPKLQKELQEAANMVAEVEQWIKSVHEELYLQMTRGVPVTGWKIVNKATRSKWVDEEAARLFLRTRRIAARDIIKPATLLTPIQVGKVLAKKGKTIDLSEFIVSQSSGTTIAPSSDKREAVEVTLQSAFKQLKAKSDLNTET